MISTNVAIGGAICHVLGLVQLLVMTLYLQEVCLLACSHCYSVIYLCTF